MRALPELFARSWPQSRPRDQLLQGAGRVAQGVCSRQARRRGRELAIRLR